MINLRLTNILPDDSASLGATDVVINRSYNKLQIKKPLLSNSENTRNDQKQLFRFSLNTAKNNLDLASFQ